MHQPLCFRLIFTVYATNTSKIIICRHFNWFHDVVAKVNLNGCSSQSRCRGRRQLRIVSFELRLVFLCCCKT